MKITEKQIPREARVAATKAHLQDRATDEIIAAALNAWPDADTQMDWQQKTPEFLILPLTKDGE